MSSEPKILVKNIVYFKPGCGLNEFVSSSTPGLPAGVTLTGTSVPGAIGKYGVAVANTAPGNMGGVNWLLKATSRGCRSFAPLITRTAACRLGSTNTVDVSFSTVRLKG